MPTSLIDALADRILIADGAMGTMLQAADLDVDDDFQGLEGCNEVLNVTRPDVVRGVHEAYLEAGADCVETNTFGTNLAALGEYDIPHRIRELAEAGARIAREAADRHSTPDRPRFVLGSIGPGTKLPTLGHAPYAALRDAYQENAAGLIVGGADALIVETCQDLLQTKAAVIGSRRAMADIGRTIPLICHVTVETTGTMLLGSEIGAALTALEPLGIDLVGLNCATGPAEMTEHLRYLSQHARVPLSVMPNAGLPELTADGARYPLTPDELAEALDRFVNEYGVSLIGGCCGTTPAHIRAVSDRLRGAAAGPRSPEVDAGVASLYHHVPFAQDASVLMVGERTNANGSKAFREAMLAGDYQACVEVARGQARDGSHLLDLCIDYVGRDGAQDMRELAGRFATASTLPIMLDSTEPNVIEAGLEMLGGRCVVNSVNFEDGDGPESRYARMMPIVKEHGAAVVALTIDEEGQARTAEWKVRVASRLIDDLTGRWGLPVSDILVDCLTFPISTGQEETRRDGIETIEAIRQISQLYPGINFTLGISNVSFGLNAAARQVLNSVFLHECVQAGLTSAIVHASKILPMSKIADEQREVALDLVYDRRREGYDPLQRFIELFEGVDVASARATRAQELAGLPLDERLKRRIIDGERTGLEADLDAALVDKSALAIINDILLDGMKVVGELFGSGQMQLPFVLQSAEVMKTSVAYLEPHMDKADDGGKGRIVLATVRGDVHDIGKNLVDIILSNNGYEVVNIGIKQPINAILDAAEQHNADAIGMSGLLVKSTVIMKENLQEMATRGVADRWPVLLGGAALTRAYVEDDLRSMFAGEVHYARDAFEGLSLMERVMAAKRGEAPLVDPAREEALAARRARRERQRAIVSESLPDLNDSSVRSDVATDVDTPAPPFFGTRVIRGIPLADYSALLDERATFLGQWGLRGSRGGSGPSYEELVETEGRPRLRYWLDRLISDKVLEAAVVYGYFPAYSEGNDLVVLDENGHAERARFTFPRQRQERRLCLADFFKPRGSSLDVVALQLVTIGHPVSEYTAKMFARNEYRDYLEVHGLSVQLTEALAEYWHKRIRAELVLPGGGTVADTDPTDLAGLLRTDYRGCRYAFGYPACPDLEDRAKIVDLLGADRIGVQLSEEFQLVPEQATDAIVVHHPEASYFNAK
ncbi:5-methyltetrahydrofolate--homocysteine methyltransferase [Phytohabitans aurantiacus]|uniref:Methionine synthase n=1 Tax=Phytohabitans aurantiacus TaxID=3016789 RepID=A0ABQ5R6E3_9ACTN|nr:methionine synthase [Phytohabitans aurantiacus]GLI02329.1 5-methyltetrahydrofolate--homocysteine methyltransferase [Phytohabitans aurantiacus]